MALKMKFNNERLLSLTALLVSVGTLVVFLYQTNLIREQQYMSVYPHLSVGNHQGNSPNYRFVLENNGIGPAIISRFLLTDRQGREFVSLHEYVNSQLSQLDSVNYSYADINKGRLIPEKQHIELIGVSDNRMHSATTLYQILNADDIKIEIEYASIYGEKWLLVSDDPIPKKLN